MRLAIVEWYDALGNNAWADIDSLDGKSLPLVTSIGWVVKDVKAYVLIASSLCMTQAPDPANTWPFQKAS